MSLNVLLVDDSPGDVRLTREALRECESSVTLHVAADGVEAMAFLRNEGAHAASPRPDFILLDLNLPRMDGHEVLANIKQDPNLSTIPTVILTTSAAKADIERCYKRSANSYLCKPVELEAFESLIASLGDFWLAKASLPRQS